MMGKCLFVFRQFFLSPVVVAAVGIGFGIVELLLRSDQTC